MRNRMYIGFIVTLLVTNAFTLMQLNRSNNYINHITSELDEKEKKLASKSETLKETYVRLDEVNSQLVYLDNEINYLNDRLDGLDDESDYVSMTQEEWDAMFNPPKEDLAKVEELRMQYYTNRQ